MKLNEVVEQAEREHDRTTPDDRQQLTGGPDRADRRRHRDREDESREDADASEGRCRARVPAIGPRIGPEGLERARPAQ